MSLTRNEWIELWGSLKIMERNNLEMQNTNIYLPPVAKAKLLVKVKENIAEIQKIKASVQSVIGQMEN